MSARSRIAGRQILSGPSATLPPDAGDGYNQPTGNPMSTETALNLPEDLRQALDQAVAAIVEIAHPQLIILFVSWAEGKAREDSDVDLLVVAETENPHRLTVQLRKAIRPFLGDMPLDLVVITPERWGWARRINGFATRDADLRGVRLHAA